MRAVKFEGFNNFRDGGLTQFGDLGQNVDGELVLTQLNVLLNALTQLGVGAVDDNREQINLGRLKLGTGHLHGVGCLFEGCIVCTHNSDYGQTQIAGNLGVEVELDSERVLGGQVYAVHDHNIAVGGNFFVGGNRAGRNFFGVALRNEL